MRFEAKYIVIKRDGFECPIVFDPLIQHIDMRNGREVISAGFVVFDRDMKDEYRLLAQCYGKSVSLGIASRQEIDSELIGRKILLNHL